MVSSRQQVAWYRWLKWGDYLIFGLIVLGATLLFLQGPALLKPVTGGEGVVRVDGQILRTISASEMQQSGRIDLESLGYHYTVEYDQGRVRISHADCPDQVCVQTGWVSRLGEVAACVPGHIILSVNPSTNAQTGQPVSTGTNEVDVVLK